MNYKDKIVWITGASSGIGKALSKDFAKEQATVILSSYEQEELKIAQTELLDFNKNIYIKVFDLSKMDEVKNAAKEILQKFGHVDVLINNGGISQRSLVTETSLEIDRKIMEVNYFAGVILTKAVLPAMIKNGYGHIVATSSISGLFGFPLRSAYAAAKHAIHGFYETVWAELKQKGINVTIVSPGRVQTNISLHALTKTGQAHGKMDDGQDNGITPEKCSQQIIRAMKKSKIQVLVGGKELIMVYIKRYFPRIFYRIITKVKST